MPAACPRVRRPVEPRRQAGGNIRPEPRSRSGAACATRSDSRPPRVRSSRTRTRSSCRAEKPRSVAGARSRGRPRYHHPRSGVSTSMKTAGIGDGSLARAAAAGDLAAFEALVRRHQHQLYREALGYLGSHDDALDAVQEALIGALKRFHQLREPVKVGPWLRTAVRRRSLNMLRDRRRRVEIHAAMERAGKVRAVPKASHPARPPACWTGCPRPAPPPFCSTTSRDGRWRPWLASCNRPRPASSSGSTGPAAT